MEASSRKQKSNDAMFQKQGLGLPGRMFVARLQRAAHHSIMSVGAVNGDA